MDWTETVERDGGEMRHLSKLWLTFLPHVRFFSPPHISHSVTRTDHPSRPATCIHFHRDIHRLAIGRRITHNMHPQAHAKRGREEGGGGRDRQRVNINDDERDKSGDTEEEEREGGRERGGEGENTSDHPVADTT